MSQVLEGKEFGPFVRLTVYSPHEAQKNGVIAISEIQLSGRSSQETKMYQYTGPTQDAALSQGSDRVPGPVINHNFPLGDETAIIKKVEFPNEGIVYVSYPKTETVSGCGWIGVWQVVNNPEVLGL